MGHGWARAMGRLTRRRHRAKPQGAAQAARNGTKDLAATERHAHNMPIKRAAGGRAAAGGCPRSCVHGQAPAARQVPCAPPAAAPPGPPPAKHSSRRRAANMRTCEQADQSGLCILSAVTSPGPVQAAQPPIAGTCRLHSHPSKAGPCIRHSDHIFMRQPGARMMRCLHSHAHPRAQPQPRALLCLPSDISARACRSGARQVSSATPPPPPCPLAAACTSARCSQQRPSHPAPPRPPHPGPPAGAAAAAAAASAAPCAACHLARPSSARCRALAWMPSTPPISSTATALMRLRKP